MSDAIFNGRVGVIIEVAPNQFHQYVLKECQGSIQIDRDMPDVGDILTRVAMVPMIATMHFVGRLVGQEEAERPAWVQEEPVVGIAPVVAAEIEAM